ncbi:MAG: hypothetical protein ACPGES_10980 [Coraliomargarita sp.]
MKVRSPIIFLILLALCTFWASLEADQPQLSAMENLDNQVESVSEARFKERFWNNGQQKSRLMNKSFPLTQYDKHFSSLGRSKAPISLTEKSEKSMFKAEVKEYDVKDLKLAEWNDQMSRLHKQARIATDQTYADLATKQRYQAMLQDSPQAYEALADELSLRDINRFAFRRNRPKGEEPPSTAAGAEGVQKAGQ